MLIDTSLHGGPQGVYCICTVQCIDTTIMFTLWLNVLYSSMKLAVTKKQAV